MVLEEMSFKEIVDRHVQKDRQMDNDDNVWRVITIAPLERLAQVS